MDEIGFGLVELAYGDVFTPEEIMDWKFLATFTEQERAILAPCLLLLIEQGCISLTFPEGEPDDPVEMDRMERPEGTFVSFEGKCPRSLVKKMEEFLSDKQLKRGKIPATKQALGKKFWSSLAKQERAFLKGAQLVVKTDGFAHLRVPK